jgi:hypothetical protein
LCITAKFNPLVRVGSKARITALQHCCPLHLNQRTSARVAMRFVVARRPAALIMGAHRLISLARVAWAASGVALCSPSNYCHCRSDWFEDRNANQNKAIQKKLFPVE